MQEENPPALTQREFMFGNPDFRPWASRWEVVTTQQLGAGETVSLVVVTVCLGPRKTKTRFRQH